MLGCGSDRIEAPIPYLPMTDEYYDHSIALHPHVAAGLAGGPAHRHREDGPCHAGPRRA